MIALLVGVAVISVPGALIMLLAQNFLGDFGLALVLFLPLIYQIYQMIQALRYDGGPRDNI